MKIILLFIVSLFLESYVFPSLFGLRHLMVVPILLLSHLVFSKDFKSVIISGVVLAVVYEILSGLGLSNVSVPLLTVYLFYYWFVNFISLDNDASYISVKNIIKMSLFVASLVYLYSLVFIFYHSWGNLEGATAQWLTLFKLDVILGIFFTSLIFSLIFSFVINHSKPHV